MAADYTVRGEMNNFNAEAMVRWAEDKQMKGSMTFDIRADPTISFELSTPFYGRFPSICNNASLKVLQVYCSDLLMVSYCVHRTNLWQV